MPIRIHGSQQTEPITKKNITHNQSNVDFGQVMSETQKIQAKELESFLHKLQEKGKELAQTFSLKDLADFKSMVKSFLRSTFGQSRQLTEESYWDFRGHPKVLARITKIDEALEELGHKVLDTQASSMEILDKIDEIRGLIIDLFA